MESFKSKQTDQQGLSTKHDPKRVGGGGGGGFNAFGTKHSYVGQGSRGYDEEKEETEKEGDKKLEQEKKGHRLPAAH
jgi:hypothetical protein